MTQRDIKRLFAYIHKGYYKFRGFNDLRQAVTAKDPPRRLKCKQRCVSINYHCEPHIPKLKQSHVLGFTQSKPWVMNHWDERVALEINYRRIIHNEPSMASTILADNIKALGPRFITHGLTTQVQYAASSTYFIGV